MSIIKNNEKLYSEDQVKDMLLAHKQIAMKKRIKYVNEYYKYMNLHGEEMEKNEKLELELAQERKANELRVSQLMALLEEEQKRNEKLSEENKMLKDRLVCANRKNRRGTKKIVPSPQIEKNVIEHSIAPIAATG